MSHVTRRSHEKCWRVIDWVTPVLNGTAWLEKPVLYYWGAILVQALRREWLGPRAFLRR